MSSSAAAASASASAAPASASLRIQTIDPLKSHRHTVIFMHGLGDTSQGFAAMFAGDYMSDALPHTRFVLPNAPMRPVSLNGGERMPAWYDIASALNRGSATEDRKSMLASAALLHRVIAEESDLIGSGNVTVAGFSQGGAMAVLAGLTFDRPLARIFAASAYAVFREKMSELIAPANAATPVMAVHGEADSMVPLDFSRGSFNKLANANVHVTYQAFEGVAHEFPREFEEEFAQFCAPSEQSFNLDEPLATSPKASPTATRSSSPKL